MEGERMEVSNMFSVLADSQYDGEQNGAIPFGVTTTNAEISAENNSVKNVSISETNEKYAKSPVTSGGYANSPQSSRNWADIVENDENFEQPKKRKRLLPSESASQSLPGPSRQTKTTRDSTTPRQPSCPRNTIEQIKVSRQMLAQCRSKAAAGTYDQMTYLEFSPEFTQVDYIKALENKLGKGCVVQIGKASGQILVGFERPDMAETIIEDGLMIKGALLKALPYQKKAEKITISGLPFVIEDADIIRTLRPYCQHAVDIAFIQETNVTTLDSVEDLCLGYRAAVAPASGARGSGLACIFSSGVQVIGQQVLSPGKIAAFDVTIRGSKATFVNCHLSHAPDERLQQLQVIAAAAVNEDAWVLGDLNISEESASDIASGSVEALGELLDRANLVDAAAIFDATHLPTRISSCGSRVDASRLDRVLIPSSFSNRVTRYWSLYYKNSDHRAVLLQTGEASEPRPTCIASMLRSRLVVGTVETLLDEALGNIEDMRNAEIWRRWGHIKAHLASAIKSLHDLRNNDDDYISRARKYVQAKLEDSSPSTWSQRDTLDRGFLVSTLLSVGLPPVFVGWVLLLYAGAEAAARIEGIGRTPLFHMLNGVRQGCAASAAFFTISTGPLLLRLEQLLGRDNVLAYADDIVLLIREDGQLEVVRKIFEDFRRASGIRVNFGKSQGLWCGRWRNRTDSSSAISWNREKINILGTLVTPGMGTSAQDQHLQELLERAIARWSPFVRGLSLAGRAKAANSLVLSAIYYHLQAYLPSETTIGRLQARLARFVWGHDRTSWLPSSILARPISVGGMGLLDVGTQLRLSCLKGVQAALRGGRNAHSWLAESGMWLTPASTPGIWLPRGVVGVFTSSNVNKSVSIVNCLSLSLSLSAVRPRGARAPRSSAMECEKMEISNVFSVLADGQYEGEHDGVVSGDKSPANAEILAEITSKKNSTNSETLENYAKLPVTSGGNANFPQSSRNWAEIVENDENFEQPKKRKRLLPSERASQSLPGPSRQTKTTRDSTTPRQPSCPRNTIEQIKVSRQMLAQCRSKAAAGTYDQMTYLEFSPEFTQVDYIKALENKLGKGCVVQIGKASGQILVGFERPDMAETIIEDGLMIKGALLKALPYQKKAEKITISGLPFVIEDADIIRTLRPYCQVVSIAPTVNSSGGYTWLDLKKNCVHSHEQWKKIKDLPKKIIVTAKGGSALAYLEYGFRCSKCYRMGHKRMNCPRIIRETSTTQPLSQTSSVKTTAPAPNTTAAASPPATFSHPAPVAAPAQTSSAPPAQEDIALETEPTTRTPETSTQTDLNINRVENSSHHKIKDRSRSLSPKAGSTAQLQLDTLLERLPGSFFGEVTLLGLKEEEVKQAIVSLPHLRLLLEKLSVEQSLGLHTFNEKLIKGLGSSKSIELCCFLKQHAVDIAFIQETNVTTLDSVEDLCLGYRAAVVPASGARGSGLACIFSSGVQVIGQQVLSPGKIAAFDVTIWGSKATFVNCHLSHAPDERLQQLQVIAAAAVNEDAWVLGDLNISEESASDIASGSVEALGELLDRANLVDAAAIFDATHLPTRISSCGSRVDASRLDRVLIPSSFSNRVTRYWSLYYKNSDHRAVLLQTGEASEPRPPCIAIMLRSRLVVGTVETLLDEALGNIEDMRNAEIWRRWGHIKAHLASAIKSLHDLRNNDDDYISRARKYVQAKLEDVSIYSDYPSLPDLGRAFRLRRRGTSSNTFYDSAGRMITGPAVRELAFVNLKERFSHPSCSPEDIDGFQRGFTLRVTIEKSDPLHRYGIGEEEIVAAIGRLPTGKAAGWDDLPCELFRGFEDYFASALRRVFEASQLCGALPTSMRRSEMSLIEKPHGGPGLAGLRPLSLPTTDYRVLSGVLYWRLRPHLRDIVPECQSYAVPGRTPAWNIARVADEVATACRDEGPLAVVAIDLESAFDTLDRGFLVSTLLSVGLPPVFVGWVLLLYAGAEAAARIEGIGRTPLFHMLNGVRQGCAASAAFFTISTGPLLLRLEQLLGRDNVLAYADDIVLLIREDGQLEVVRKIFEDFRRASGIRVNFGKSQGLWCGRWRNRTDSPSAISWNREKINILGTLVTPGMGTSAQDQHLQELLERAIARWSPFVRGLSLAGRAKAANSLVLSAIYYHLQAYLPMARFVWGHDRTSWLPSSILARPISVGGMGLLDVGTQLRLSCLKGVQAALRGGRNAHSWLAESGMWLTPASTPGIWLPPRRRRSLHLFEPAAEILDLNHRILQPALLRALRVVGDCRFLRPPELLAPTRWLGWRIGELTGPAPNITIATRGALTDVAALGCFCTRLITQNARGRYRVDSLADAIVVRGSTTAFQRLTTRTARRLLERPRLAALPITQLFGRWFPHVSIPISISWSSLRRCAFRGTMLTLPCGWPCTPFPIQHIRLQPGSPASPVGPETCHWPTATGPVVGSGLSSWRPSPSSNGLLTCKAGSSGMTWRTTPWPSWRPPRPASTSTSWAWRCGESKKTPFLSGGEPYQGGGASLAPKIIGGRIYCCGSPISSISSRLTVPPECPHHGDGMPSHRRSNLSQRSNSSRVQHAYRLRETRGQNIRRLREQSARQAALQSLETPDPIHSRLQAHSERYSSTRRNTRTNNFFSSVWSSMENAGFNYSVAVEYFKHPLIALGMMDTTCRF
ncbi:hypothetical protein LAZ67_11002940, partial [Cordylochernes scorpioides]